MTEVTVGIEGARPIRQEGQASWKAGGTTPEAAATESRFIAAALTGTSSERKATSRTMKLSPTTIAIISGSLSLIWLARSM